VIPEDKKFANIKKYIRVKGNKLQVCTVNWKGPHEPVSEWVTVETLSRSIESLDIEAIDSFGLRDPDLLDIEELEPLPIELFATNAIEQLDIEAIWLRLLKNKEYFGFCKKCNEYNIEGHMHGDSLCQSCAESHLGICY